MPALRLHPDDDIALLREFASSNSVVLSVVEREAIGAGHKVACTTLPRALSCGITATDRGCSAAGIGASLLAVASGAPTKSEALGVGDHGFVPWQLGAWM